MADLTITGTSVVKGSNAITLSGIAGVTILAGEAVYLDTATGTYKLSDTDSATALARGCAGIALNGAAVNQAVEVQYDGKITIGATVAAGVPYFLSGTAGKICPLADVAAGDYPLFIGFGVSVTEIDLHLIPSGVVMV